MAFSLYFFVAWIIVAIFFSMKKWLTSAENAFLFLFLLVVSVNWYWILFEETKRVEVSEQPLVYVALLINRSVTVPLLTVIALNQAWKAGSRVKAFIWPSISVVVLTGLSYVGIILQVKEVHRWNIFYDLLFYIFLHLTAYLVIKFFRDLQRKEAKM